MQPVKFTEWKDSWHLKFSDKKKLFGSQRAEHCQKVSDEIDEKLVTRKDDVREPVAYHSQNRDYYVTLLEDNNIAKFVDFSLLDGESAVVCVERGIPIAGMALTGFHKEAVQKRVIHQTFKLMATEGSLIYEPALANIIGSSLKMDAPKGQVSDTTDGSTPKKRRIGSEASPSDNKRAVTNTKCNEVLEPGPKRKRGATPKAKPKGKAKAKAKAASADKLLKEDLLSHIKALKNSGGVVGGDDDEDEVDLDDDDEGEEEEDE